MKKKIYVTPSLKEIKVKTQSILAGSYPDDVNSETLIDSEGIYGD